jgi:hypothetical protein
MQTAQECDAGLRHCQRKLMTTAFTYPGKCIAELTQCRPWCKLKPPNETEYDNEK